MEGGCVLQANSVCRVLLAPMFDRLDGALSGLPTQPEVLWYHHCYVWN
jgi:hypothetical protein